ncbi:LOW QUALITY PROTEIN: DPOL-like protein, partial [Mya arenaria]
MDREEPPLYIPVILNLCGRNYIMATDLDATMTFVDIGSNDLCNPTATPSIVANAIISFAQDLLSGGCKVVIISEILPRQGASVYNQRVDDTNAQLEGFCSGAPQMIFWRHSRNNYNTRFLTDYVAPDGIHVDPSRGMRSMPKRRPNEVTSGKGKASKPQQPGQNRLATLVAAALSNDEDILEEISSLLLAKLSKQDGTAASMEDVSDSVSEVSVNSVDNADIFTEPSPQVDLGVFSIVHPPVEKTLRIQILNREYVELSRLIFLDSTLQETRIIKKSDHQTVTSVQTIPVKNTIHYNMRYADIYCTKYPLESPELFKYMTVIQSLAHFNPHCWLISDSSAPLPLCLGEISTQRLICSVLSKALYFFVPNNFPNHPCQTMSCDTVGNSSSEALALNQSAPLHTAVATAPTTAMVPTNAPNLSVSTSLTGPQASHINSTLPPARHQIPPNNIPLPTPVRANDLAKFSKWSFPGTTATPSIAIHSNHPSVSTHLDFVRSKVISEIKLGRVKGPYLAPPLPNCICSPLGVVPKKSSTSFRVIHDLSFSRHSLSVNATIPPEHSTVTLETFDTVARLDAGRGALIAKADIEEAFKIIPISPLDYHKLGFSINKCFYFGTVLPMGASSSVQIFDAFSSCLQWILQNQFSVKRVSHIVDDFIFVGQRQSDECLSYLNIFFSLAQDIGVPIKHQKTVMPSTLIEVHGILIDTETLTARLPQDKLQTLKSLLSTSMKRRKVTLHQLQSILGHLNFACKVIKPGRCFLRRLYDSTVGVSNKHHFIKLSAECRADLNLWYSFLDKYNGCTLLTGDRFISSDTLHLHTDAAGSKAVFLFGKSWHNKNILFICDNLAVVHCLNSQTSKDPVMMKLIRIIVLQALEHIFCFRSKHIPTAHNTMCDLLSRFQVEKALRLAPHLDPIPLPILHHEQLLEASLAPSTRAVYSKSWTKFKDFHANFASHQPVLPLSVDLITSFVAHLFKQGLSPSTINSNLSVISYFHSHSGFPDPCANTQVRRMTLGCRKLKQHVDTRLPLHTHITLLIQGVASLYQSSPYLQKLYCAIILLAFFVFFLIGELLPLSPHLSSAVVQRQHVTVSPTFLRLHLHNYKTQKTDKPLTILIKSQSPLCPVKALQAYFLVRGTKMAHYSCLPFHHQFQLRSFGPFSMNFLFTLTFPNFRIGACIQAALLGVPDNEIMRMGRWRSNAFRRYIRLPNI